MSVLFFALVQPANALAVKLNLIDEVGYGLTSFHCSADPDIGGWQHGERYDTTLLSQSRLDTLQAASDLGVLEFVVSDTARALSLNDSVTCGRVFVDLYDAAGSIVPTDVGSGADLPRPYHEICAQDESVDVGSVRTFLLPAGVDIASLVVIYRSVRAYRCWDTGTEDQGNISFYPNGVLPVALVAP